MGRFFEALIVFLTVIHRTPGTVGIIGINFFVHIILKFNVIKNLCL